MSAPSSEVSNVRSPFIPPDGLINRYADIFINHKQKRREVTDRFRQGQIDKHQYKKLLKEIKTETDTAFNNLKIASHLSPEERDFFQNYDLDILGGIGNSLNIVIADRNDLNRTEQVLTISKPMSTNIFLPDDARQKAVNDGALAPKQRIPTPAGKEVNISLSPRYQGSFESLYERKGLSREDVQEQCATNIKKLAEKLQVMQDNKIFFPDAKVTNWLLDGNNNPIVTDDKSHRTYSQARKQATDRGVNSFVHTDPYWPQNLKSLNTDKDFEAVHAYTLGSNIYDYLTGWEPPQGKLTEMSFSNPVFQNDIGVRYKRLIENLRHPNPSARMSLAEASRELSQIQYDIKNNIGLGQRPEEIAQREAKEAEDLAERQAYKKVTGVYEHAKQAKKNRYLANNVTVPDDCEKLTKFKNLKGDLLKTKILISLQREIDKVESREQLATLREEIKQRPEYKILETYQGLIHRKSSRGTKSEQALEKLFEDKNTSLPEEVDNPLRTSFRMGPESS